MIEVDARGFSCPIPVVRTKKAIEDNRDEPLVVLVETAVSKENVSRLAESKGYKISFGGFMKTAFPYMILSIGICQVWLMLFKPA